MADEADESWSGDCVLGNVVWDALQLVGMTTYVKIGGSGWMKTAENREDWCELGEANYD